uniref:Alternative protein ACER3 n=1 Tax=Homo sapiens TaxID=9606 RepID=L8E8G3_HUMAN|nr:alternative protein ACER3 [Homo sapiens]
MVFHETSPPPEVIFLILVIVNALIINRKNMFLNNLQMRTQIVVFCLTEVNQILWFKYNAKFQDS